MSMRAICLAVRDHLRSGASGGLNYAADRCDIMVDGMPPPAAGEWFIAIHQGNWTGQYIEGFAEDCALQITVSVRAPVLPFDRIGHLLYEKTPNFKGLWWFVEEIRVSLALDVGGDDILNKANVYIGTSANGFQQTTQLIADMGRPQRQGPHWFGSDEMEVEIAGVSQTLSIGPFGRFQGIEYGLT